MPNQSPRIIINSRYCRVARPGEQADGKNIIGVNAMENLIRYVGTREGVVQNYYSPTSTVTPATEKQKERIDMFLKDAPDLLESIEYSDYTENPTIANASALISAGTEILLMQNGLADEMTVKALVEYVGTRPGVDRQDESHGLFGYKDNIDLNEAAAELCNHTGRIWRHVISLRREDADRLGYNTQKPWKLLIQSHLHELAELSGIKPENLRWYAGMHDEGHHPHIHLFVYSVDSKEGFISPRDIQNMKSVFAKDIFREDMKPIYEQKTAYRNEITHTARELLHIDALENCARDDITGGLSHEKAKQLIDDLQNLKDLLPEKGRMVYKYMPPSVKEKIDIIANNILKDSPILTELFEKWKNVQKEIDQTYLEEPKERFFTQEASFNPVKNAILQAAVSLKNPTMTKEYRLALQEIRSAAIDGNPKIQYRYAKELLRLGQEEEATMWFGLASAKGHAFASYELTQRYAQNGDSDLASHYYEKLLAQVSLIIKNEDILDDILNSDYPDRKTLDFLVPDSSYCGKLEEMLGKLLEKGIGTEQNREKAKLLYEMAYTHGCSHLGFKLGQMAQQDGISSDAVFWFLKAAEANIPAAQYALAQLSESGENPLIEQNLENARLLYETAAEKGYRLAKMRLSELNSVKEAISKEFNHDPKLSDQTVNQDNEQSEEAEKEEDPLLSDLAYSIARVFSTPVRNHLQKQLQAGDHREISEEQKRKASLGYNPNDRKHTTTY